jgi:rhomboid protease GluP
LTISSQNPSDEEPSSRQTPNSGDNQPKRNSSGSFFNTIPISFVIIVITVLFYGLQLVTYSILGVDLPEQLFMKVNELILQGQLWRLLTPVLLHASILHILSNMYALFIIGPSVEREYGRWRFLLLYVISAIFGNTLSFFFTQAPSLGASTAIFGLITAQGVYVLRNRVYFGNSARPMLLNILFVIVINLAIGFLPGIDYWGHIGGLLGGLIFSWLAGPLYESKESLSGMTLVERKQTSPTTIFLTELILVALLVLFKFVEK